MRDWLQALKVLNLSRLPAVVVSLLVSHGVWIGLFVVSFTAYLANYLANVEITLRYDRQMLIEGELWRLFTGHLLHLNSPHLWLNMAGVLIVASFFNGSCSTRQWLLLLFFSAVWISLGLFLFVPNMLWYMGLSGVLHSLFVVGAWHERQCHPLSGNILLILLLVKVIVEQMGGGLDASEAMIGATIAVDAHLFGVIAGVVFIGIRAAIALKSRRDK